MTIKNKLKHITAMNKMMGKVPFKSPGAKPPKVAKDGGKGSKLSVALGKKQY